MRTLIRGLLAALLMVVAGLAATLTSPLTTASAAGARPTFQVPFPCNETWRMTTYEGHGGGDIDFNWGSTSSADLGKPVLAAAAGTVTYSGWLSPGGNHIEIDHGYGWKTAYAHLNARSVTAGTHVGQGQKIGTVGNTGTSSGPHLHFETRADGVSTQVYFNGSYAGVSDISNRYGPVNITSRNACKATVFASGSSSLYFDQGGERINLKVCASNLAGQSVTARLSRQGRDFGNVTRTATSSCYTFYDLDGAGAVLRGTTYSTRAALNQAPSPTWPIPCGAVTGSRGLCDKATLS